MTLSSDDVKKLAELARLDLSDDELSVMQQELGSILHFVDRLQQVKTEGVEPSSAPATSEWREDIAVPCDEATREILLSNFPARKGDLLATPGVFERPKGSSTMAASSKQQEARDSE